MAILRSAILAASLITACGASPANPVSVDEVAARRPAAPEPPPARSSPLRQVDFCNREYGDLIPPLVDCRGTREQRHRPGEGIHGTLEVRLTAVVYGDLTGDGDEEALLVLEETSRPVLLEGGSEHRSIRLLAIALRGEALIAFGGRLAGSARLVRASVADGVARIVREAERECVDEVRLEGEQLVVRSTSCL